MYEYIYYLESLNGDENLQKIVKDRVSFLRSAQHQNSRTRKTTSFGFSSGFFAEDEKITFGVMDFGYVMNDDKVFGCLIDNLRLLKAENPGKEYKNLIPKAVKKTTEEYFENKDKQNDYPKYIKSLYDVFKNDETWKAQLDYVRDCYKGVYTESQILKQIELQAREWFPIYASKNNSTLSIESIKGLGFAKCVEYAALSNQLFGFLGIPTYYVENQMACKSESAESHAYNIIGTEKGMFLYDGINSIMKKIPSKEEADALMEGNKTFSIPEHNISYGVGASLNHQPETIDFE